jgi:hypothetical protein
MFSAFAALCPTFTAGLKAVAAAFGFAQQRDAEKNSAAMQANAAAQTDAQISADATKAVAARDTAAVEKGLAE